MVRVSDGLRKQESGRAAKPRGVRIRDCLGRQESGRAAEPRGVRVGDGLKGRYMVYEVMLGSE